jgi:hypothetical protein
LGQEGAPKIFRPAGGFCFISAGARALKAPFAFFERLLLLFEDNLLSRLERHSNALDAFACRLKNVPLISVIIKMKVY